MAFAVLGPMPGRRVRSAAVASFRRMGDGGCVGFSVIPNLPVTLALPAISDLVATPDPPVIPDLIRDLLTCISRMDWRGISIR